MSTSCNFNCPPHSGGFSTLRKNQILTVSAITLCGALAGGQSVALAEQSPSDRNFDRRVYIGINAGITQLEPRTDNTPFNVGDDSSSGGSIYLGYDLTKHWSIEGYSAQLGKAAINRNLDNTLAGEIDYESFGISAIGYFKNSRNSSSYKNGFDDEGYFRREGLSPFARIGFGTLDTSSNSVDFTQLEDIQLHLGLGVEYGWSNGIAARAELISYDKDAQMIALGVLKRFGHASPYPVATTPATPLIEPKPQKPEAPVKKPVPAAAIEFPTVHFPFDRSHLTGVAKAILDSFVADILQPDPRLRFGIHGHTDSHGSESYNLPLSNQRAESVKAYLQSKGIGESRMETKGFGENSPLNTNGNDEERANNRRVDFKKL